MAYRTRDLLVRQRTQTINALRAHLAEQGIVAPAGPAHVGRLAAAVEGDDGALPVAVRDLARLLLDQIADLRKKDRRFGYRAALVCKYRRHCATTDHYSGHRSAHRRGDHDLRTADGDIFERARFRGMGWPDSEATFERRQGTSWPNIEDGSKRHPTLADHWRHRSGEMGSTQRRPGRLVARADACAQTDDAGRGGPGQLHGTDGVGLDAQG